MKKHLLLTAIILVPTFALLGQQPFDQETKKNALTSSDGYKQRLHDERFEGLYIERFNSSVQVVSLTQGGVDYEMDKDEKLVLQVPPELNFNGIVGVIGKSFGLNKHYRLDLLLEGKKKKEVPVSEVIAPKVIPPGNLGIYGYVGDPDQPKLYIPVRMSSKKINKKPKAIYLVIVSNTNQDKIIWQYSEISGQGSCSNFVSGTPLPAQVPVFFGGRPIRILLDLPETIKPGNEVCIQVNLRTANSTHWENVSFRMLKP